MDSKSISGIKRNTENSNLKVYLSARVSVDAQDWNEYVCSYLTSPIDVFIPHLRTPTCDDHRQIPLAAYIADLCAMQDADVCLALPPYGRDCSWELGWFSNSEKPIILYVENDTEWMRDWMVKGGLDYLITTNQEIVSMAINDPILSSKSILQISNISELRNNILNIMNNLTMLSSE